MDATPTTATVDAPPPNDPAVQPTPTPSDASAGARYRAPPPDVVKVVDAPPSPAIIVAPDGAQLVQAAYDPLPPIEVVAAPFLRLAGLRINPARSALRQTSHYTDLTLQRTGDGATTAVTLEDGARLNRPTWSPDGAALALTIEGASGLELWIVDARTGAARRLIEDKVTNVIGAAYRWMPDSRALLVRLVPPRAPAPPPAPTVPSGPLVQDTAGRAATNRTYQDLLETPHDADVFEYYARSQLAIVTTDGQVTRVGPAGIYDEARPSPDGRFIQVTRLTRPFSYVVPYYRFPRELEIWDREGARVRELATLPASEEVPIQGVPTGPRRLSWQPRKPATLVWAEALDGGDPRREVDHRDHLLRLNLHEASAAPQELLKVQQRFSDLLWLDSEEAAIVSEYDRDRRWTTTRVHFLARERAPVVLDDRSYHDRYGDPGWPVQRERADGTWTVVVDDGWIYLDGSGATPEGDRPFLDRLHLERGEKQRLLRSPADAYHSFVAFAGAPGPTGRPLLVRRESRRDPPNYFIESAGEGGAAARPLTQFPDPHPQLTGIEKKLLKYKRADGVELSATLYLPPARAPGERLPLVIWAYPREYNDAGTAGQVRAAPNRFTRLGGTSPLMFLLRGYAVLDRTAMPVIGDPETMNDTFVEQIVGAAQAAIDAADAEGAIDRSRVAIAGHSYGAFMTANLLAHSDLFRAGIARSGAYNRTLTPFGFQGERRTLWEATSTYVELSPLMHADAINEPLLLIHGEADNNSGTFPLQSRRLFHALQGLGGTARLVVLPHESHGYRARESVLHVLAESFDWLDAHMQPAAPAPVEDKAP
ncbi:MAG: prolyl oligopeptidase family serine peptidase [Myxococcales bacterium]|nr:prolyl oligopeptidase family serine peptidase [Myxococcales bacterium]